MRKFASTSPQLKIWMDPFWQGVLWCIVVIGFSVQFCFSEQIAQGEPPKSSVTQDLYNKAHSLRKERELIKAQKLLSEIVVGYPDFESLSSVQKELESLNIEIICSNFESMQSTQYSVNTGDTLKKIAQKFHTTVELIKKRNHLSSDIIKVGQKLSIWKGVFTIEVDKSDNVLVLKNEDGIVKVYPVSTGKETTLTPAGEFVIKDRLENPAWFHHGDVIPPGTPKNFLGTRWLGFDLPKYGIHGTVEPQLIGKSVSGGCVRMRNHDVEELYLLIPEGTKVVIKE